MSIVPELSAASGGDICFLDFIPADAVLWVKDFVWLKERIQTVYEEAFSPQALAAYEGEQDGLKELEKQLVDGGEFCVRALEFRRIDFGHKALVRLRLR